MRFELRTTLAALMVLDLCCCSAQADKPRVADGAAKPVAQSTTLEVVTYKKIGDVSLNMHTISPGSGENRPAIVLFFCGGWKGFNARKYFPQSVYFASRGIVCFNAEVRVIPKHGTTPAECVIDAKSAVRWVRKHAADYGVNPNRVATLGGSAAGHVSAATAVIDGFDDPADDKTISSRPNAFIAFCPALILYDNERRVGLFGGMEKARALSPILHIKPGNPPGLLLHGAADKRVVPEESTRFAAAMKKAGNRCEVKLYSKAGHGFHNWFGGNNPRCFQSMEDIDTFLQSLGWLTGKSTAKEFRYTSPKRQTSG